MGKRYRWTDDQLRDAVATSRSYASVLRKIGLVPLGGNYRTIQFRIGQLGLDVAHFTGKGWNVGANYRPIRPREPFLTMLVEGRNLTTSWLRERLIDEGLKKAACELCGWAMRAPDGRLPLELDHKNGDHFDNRLENLRVLCPNCHSLQPTHRGRNRLRNRDRK